MAIQNEDFLLVNRAAAPFKTKFSTFVSDIVHVGADEPDAERVSAGSLWLDTTVADDPRLQIYDGTQWVETKAQIPETPIVIVGPNPPTEKKQGDLWWDSVNGTLYLYYIEDDYNDGAGPGTAQWVEAAPGAGGGDGDGASIHVGQSPPAPPSDQGDLWFNQDTGTLYIYYIDPSDDEYWIEVAAPGGGGGDGANVTVSENPPAAGDTTPGDLWYCTDDGRLYIYYDDGDSQQWVDASPPGAGGEGGGGGDYTLPTATAIRLGGIKVGANLTVEADGTLNAADPDGSVATPNLQEVTTAGNATTNDIVINDKITLFANGTASFVDGGVQFAGDENFGLVDLDRLVGEEVWLTTADDDHTAAVKIINVAGEETISLHGAGYAAFQGTVNIGGTLPASPNITLDASGEITAQSNVRSNGFIQSRQTSADESVWSGELNGTPTSSILADGSGTFSGFVDFVRDATDGFGYIGIGPGGTKQKGTFVNRSDQMVLELYDDYTGTADVKISSDGTVKLAGPSIGDSIELNVGTTWAWQGVQGGVRTSGIQWDGTVQVGGNANAGGEIGARMYPGGYQATQDDDSDFLWRGFKVGNTTPTSSIQVDGSASFVGGDATIGLNNTFGAYFLVGGDPSNGVAEGVSLSASGQVTVAAENDIDTLWQGYKVGAGTGNYSSLIKADGSANFGGSVTLPRIAAQPNGDGDAYIQAINQTSGKVVANFFGSGDITLSDDLTSATKIEIKGSDGSASFAGNVSRINTVGSLLLGTTSFNVTDAKIALDAASGAGTFDGSIAVGGSAAGVDGAIEGTFISTTGRVYATTSNGNLPVYEGYTLGNGTPTSQIFGNGSASFTGGATFGSTIIVNENPATPGNVGAALYTQGNILAITDQANALSWGSSSESVQGSLKANGDINTLGSLFVNDPMNGTVSEREGWYLDATGWGSAYNKNDGYVTWFNQRDNTNNIDVAIAASNSGQTVSTAELVLGADGTGKFAGKIASFGGDNLTINGLDHVRNFAFSSDGTEGNLSTYYDGASVRKVCLSTSNNGASLVLSTRSGGTTNEALVIDSSGNVTTVGTVNGVNVSNVGAALTSLKTAAAAATDLDALKAAIASALANF